jgi:hypothetical protein
MDEDGDRYIVPSAHNDVTEAVEKAGRRGHGLIVNECGI